MPPLDEGENYLQIVDIAFGVLDSPATEKLNKISELRRDIDLEKKRIQKHKEKLMILGVESEN